MRLVPSRIGAVAVGLVAVVIAFAPATSTAAACPGSDGGNASSVIGLSIPDAAGNPPAARTLSCDPAPSSGGGADAGTGGSGSPPGSGSGGVRSGGGGVGGSAAGVPTPAGTTAETEGELVLDPTRVVAGEMITATGSGYTPGEVVTLMVQSGNVLIDEYTADASGNLSIIFTVPDDTRVGSHAAEASGATSGMVNSGEFDVVSAASGASGGPPSIVWVLGILALLVIGAAVALIVVLRSGVTKLTPATGAPA